MSQTYNSPSEVAHSTFESVRALFAEHVIPCYGRFDLGISHGAGSYVFDFSGKRYLDLGSGIAVCCVGHAHPEIAEAAARQARRLMHTSNLYYTEPQGRLAASLVRLLGRGKVFFCNSGAEANEGLFKAARKFGHDEGRFEVLTTLNSFHGRTLAGISATGQDKVKKGFEPMVPGFRHVPFNDLAAMREAISPATAAILVEGIQGEGGITSANPDYLLGLRALCDEKRLLFLMDEVQCGHFRTGRFQSFQRILEGSVGGDRFLPDGISIAKSLGGGFPIGAFWLREPYGDLLTPGTHASTFGGTPLACAVALKVLEIIERDQLAENARVLGAWFKDGLESLARKYPQLIQRVRGLGLMLGIELAESIPALCADGKPPSGQLVARLQELGVLVIPAGTRVVRFLPPLNLSRTEAAEGLAAVERVLESCV